MGTPFGEESSDSLLLPRPLTPQPLVEVMVVESSVECATKVPVAGSPPCIPDLSREGPFDVHQVTTDSGASPCVLDSLPGCQYRMTSYDVANSGGRVAVATRRGPDIVEYSGPRTVCYIAEPDGIGGHAGGA